MSAQPHIPSGRPQPKLSKLVVQQTLDDSVTLSKCVFWDLQNTPLPADLCAFPDLVVERLTQEFAAVRLTIVTEVPASTQPGADLLRALNSTKGVEVLTFLRGPHRAASGTAADFELKRVRVKGSYCSLHVLHTSWSRCTVQANLCSIGIAHQVIKLILPCRLCSASWPRGPAAASCC